MAQVILICDGNLSFNNAGRPACDNWILEPYDQNLADALVLHSQALQDNTSAMNSFFTLNASDVSLISALMLATFITGNALGKVAHIMRKA